LYLHPYDATLYLWRARVHLELGYADLAASDAYRALLLTDEARDDSGEYHDEATEALADRQAVGKDEVDAELGPEAEQQDGDGAVYALLERCSRRAYTILVQSLTAVGCLASAYDFHKQAVTTCASASDQRHLALLKDQIRGQARLKLGRSDELSDAELDDLRKSDRLSDHGTVRREIYPWNEHEPDRFSERTLTALNAMMRTVAPKCEVRVTELPALKPMATTKQEKARGKGYREGEEEEKEEEEGEEMPTITQLGLFATEDIPGGEVVLREASVLTANNRLHESLCDACSTAFTFPSHDDMSSSQGGGPIPCPSCDDIFFCSPMCLERAQALYHPSVCGKEVETIGKEVSAQESPEALYLLLLARALAMSFTTDTHPLELEAVKYIWGDFSNSLTSTSASTSSAPVSTLPFTYTHNINMPLHVLTKMDINIWTTLELTDTWILNTLYAKFRGTASARLSTRAGDSRPEVCAVHPAWSLANHSCAPNVMWEWGGEMCFVARRNKLGRRMARLRLR
ncbi:MAG: hypothetical protein M1838_003987, partial [Thelocarpon superellum]